MKKYVDANICSNSSITVRYALKTLSSSSETIIFIFLGVSTVSDRHVWNTWFVVATIAFCTIYRFIGKTAFLHDILRQASAKLYRNPMTLSFCSIIRCALDDCTFESISTQKAKHG